MADVLDINLINRQIDEELAKAKAKYGPRHFDIIVLEGSRGDTLDDRTLLRQLRYLINLIGSRFKAVLNKSPRRSSCGADALAKRRKGVTDGRRLLRDLSGPPSPSLLRRKPFILVASCRLPM